MQNLRDILDLAKTDQKIRETARAVKQQEVRVTKVEKTQKKTLAILAVTLLLVCVTGGVAFKTGHLPVAVINLNLPSNNSVTNSTPIEPDGANKTPQYTAFSPVTMQSSSVENGTSESVSAPSIENSAEPPVLELPLPEELPLPDEPLETTTTSDPVSIENSAKPPVLELPSETDNYQYSISAPQETTELPLPEELPLPDEPLETTTTSDPVSIDLHSLVGTYNVRPSVYFSIVEHNELYYISFVFGRGSLYHYLHPYVPLVSQGNAAVATYDSDNQGNGGRIEITFDGQGDPIISASVNNKWVPAYTSGGDLNALILDNQPMYYNEEIKDYPIYKDFLVPAFDDDIVDLSFLLIKEYPIITGSRETLTFSEVRGDTISFVISDSRSNEIYYQGEVVLSERFKDYIILTGKDAQGGDIRIEAYYKGHCRVQTEDEQYALTVFK